MPVAEETLSISDVIVQLQDYSPTVRIQHYLNNNCENIVAMTDLNINLKYYLYRYPILSHHLFAQKLDLRQMTLECKFISAQPICIHRFHNTYSIFIPMLLIIHQINKYSIPKIYFFKIQLSTLLNVLSII